MIYLDNNATTCLDPEVKQFVFSLLDDSYPLLGNPSSTHSFGRKAKKLVRESIENIKSFFNTSYFEVLFTSGATEALNTLINSLPSGHIISSSIEHPSVIEPLKRLDNCISFLDPLPGNGTIVLSQIEENIKTNTVALVLGSVNSETGAKLPLEEIAQFAKERNLIFIVDGVSSVCKEEINLFEGISAFCFSSHKIHSLGGTGVVLLHPSFRIKPFLLGGHQQLGKRAGTENVLSIAALGYALKITKPKLLDIIHKISILRDYLENSLLNTISDIEIHSFKYPRICNISNIAFLGLEGEILQASLDLEGVSVGYGTACSSGIISFNSSLIYTGISAEEAASSLRFSLSRFSTKEEIDEVLKILINVVLRLRS